MTIIKEVFILCRIAYYELALSSVHLAHEDVPDIVLHLRNLNDELDSVRGY